MKCTARITKANGSTFAVVTVHSKLDCSPPAKSYSGSFHQPKVLRRVGFEIAVRAEREAMTHFTIKTPTGDLNPCVISLTAKGALNKLFLYCGCIPDEKAWEKLTEKGYSIVPVRVTLEEITE